MNYSDQEYISGEEYHQAMMFDFYKERAEELENKLLMVEIELSFSKIRAKMWEDLYNQVESNTSKV